MLSGANSACVCRATIATPKPLVKRLTSAFDAEDAPMPTCLRRERKKNHTTPLPALHPHSISMTLPLVGDLVRSPRFACTHHFDDDFFLPCLANRQHGFVVVGWFVVSRFSNCSTIFFCCSPDTLVSSGVFVEPFLQGDADHDSAPVGSDYCIKHKETSWTKGNSPSRTTWFAKERYRATVPNDGQRLVRFYFLHISCKQQRC